MSYRRHCGQHRQPCQEALDVVRCPVGHRVRNWDVVDERSGLVVALGGETGRVFDGFAEKSLTVRSSGRAARALRPGSTLFRIRRLL